MSRRQQLLATAAELFAARGFHGVSVGDIGAACGISGPALYRHFPSKDAMLAEMLVSISEKLLEVGRARVFDARGPAEALHVLVDWHLEFALHNKPLIIVQDREWASLPDEAQEQVRTLQRAYVELWVAQLVEHHPSLEPARARAAVHATFGLLNSTPRSSHLPERQMAGLLRAMALGALDTDLGTSG
ncbi:MAG TPA: TetR/AcrR family transcriptional regulator [Marmoricola sp.]|nr:TetR/AcrR family transcriptional regulator [Marmoricola sp.]